MSEEIMYICLNNIQLKTPWDCIAIVAFTKETKQQITLKMLDEMGTEVFIIVKRALYRYDLKDYSARRNHCSRSVIKEVQFPAVIRCLQAKGH